MMQDNPNFTVELEHELCRLHDTAIKRGLKPAQLPAAQYQVLSAGRGVWFITMLVEASGGIETVYGANERPSHAVKEAFACLSEVSAATMAHIIEDTFAPDEVA